MASIIKVNGKWRALIRRKGHRAICKTHATKAAAEAWARGIESQMDAGRQIAEERVTVADLIDAYRKLRAASRPIRDDSNTHYMLKALRDGLGDVNLAALTVADLIAYSTMRREQGAGPYTVNMDISQLGTVLRYSEAVLKVKAPDVTGQARPMLAHLGLIGGGGKRERRPTEDEIVRIVAWLNDNKGAIFGDWILFSIATAMRRGEVERAEWAHVDTKKRLLLIRDRKDPRQKAGNDQWIPLLPEAWDILQRQPRDGDLIFPRGGSVVSKYFTDCCRALSIPDLHLHDLRHEGTSRLFESGYPLEQVALVTGHRDWRNLKRYTQLKPESLHRVKPPGQT